MATYAELQALEDAAPVYKSYTPLVPPTETLEDGSLEITDYVKGVSLSEVTFDEQNNAARFTFEDEHGATISKFINEPMDKPHIARLDDDDANKKLWASYDYQKALGIFKKFVKDDAIKEALGDVDFNIELLVAHLAPTLSDPENLLPTENTYLKITFKKASGEKPAYKVPDNAFLITTPKKPKPNWFINKKSPAFSDIHNFAVEASSTPDYGTAPLNLSQQASDANDIFGAPTTIAPPTLNVDDLNLG